MFDTEQALIAALLEQDAAAYREAIKRYQPAMKYLATSIVGEKIADEVVQEAWFSVLRALPKFQGRSKLKTWLLTIVANEAKTRLRKEKRMVSMEDMLASDTDFNDRFDGSEHWLNGPSEWHGDSPDALLSSADLEHCLEISIELLPSLQGATLNLKERQGYSLTEICNILNVSDSNVRVLLHRARNKLFQVIEHFQRTGDCLSQSAGRS